MMENVDKKYIAEVTSNLLVSQESQDNSMTESLVTILDKLVNIYDQEDLFSSEIVGFVMAVSESDFCKLPLIKLLLSEIKLRMLRASTCGMDNVQEVIDHERYALGHPQNNVGYPERYFPSKHNHFLLPAEGELISYQACRFSRDKKTYIVRDVLLDHDGYVVKLLNEKRTPVNSNQPIYDILASRMGGILGFEDNSLWGECGD